MAFVSFVVNFRLVRRRRPSVRESCLMSRDACLTCGWEMQVEVSARLS